MECVAYVDICPCWGWGGGLYVVGVGEEGEDEEKHLGNKLGRQLARADLKRSAVSCGSHG